MKRSCTENNGSRIGTRPVHGLAAGAVLLVLAGCSSTPDWANPVEWYRGTRDAIVGTDEAESTDKTAKPVAGETPGKDKPFPNLASVPELPKTPSEEERKTMARDLAADRENAKYTEEVIKRQTESVPPPASATTATASPKPAPSQGSAPVAPRRTAAAPAPVAAPPSIPAPAGASSDRDAVMQAAARQVQAPWRPATGESGQSARFGAAGPLPPLESRPPQFDPPPAAPQIAGEPSSARSFANRPSPSSRSISRIGNPTFGAPPADIAAALGADSAPASQGSFAGGLASAPAGTLGGPSGVAGERVATIRFEMGSAKLDEGERRQIAEIARNFRARGGAIRVEGHASSRTKDMRPVQHSIVNFEVSLSRANAVASELIRQGVPAGSVFVAAMSDSDPIFYEVMPAGEAGNQRVEVFFVN